MDTTAAAELGLTAVGPGVDGVGFWDNEGPDRNRQSSENVDQFSNPRKLDGGQWEKGTSRRGFGRHSRPASSSGPPEPPHKRPRTAQAETSGEGDGYGERFDGGYGEGSSGTAFARGTYGDSDNGAASRSEKMNPGFGGIIAGGALPGHGETRRANNFSGDVSSDARPQTPNSSGASGSPFTVRGKGTGSIFFKTKLCTKFRAGTCPYNSNCNFAHGMDELRKPPPGWEEIVAVQDAERSLRNRETSGQPIMANVPSGNSSDFQRLHKTRPCKKYYSEEGCPYGDRCNFLHDDQAGARESNAISLGPSSSPSRGAGGGGGGGNGNERPPNWKTRMCNKWETTGHCPFGQKCHFAHGLAELQAYGGAHAESEVGTASGGNQRSDAKQGGQSSFKTFPDIGPSHASTLHGTDGHNSVAASKYGGSVLVSMQIQKQPAKSIPKWKGPADEISTIYGDWIEEDEWERPSLSLKPATEQLTEKTIQHHQQLAVPLKGNVMNGVSGLRQDGETNYSKGSKHGLGPMQVGYGNVTLYGAEGADGEEL